MNKNTLISLGVVLVLALYLIISKIDFSSDVVELKEWDGVATEIIIKKEDNTVKIFKKDGKWLLNEEQYPANSSLIGNMEKKLKELEIDSLVSEKTFYSKYDLTPEKSTEITVKKENDVVRHLIVGKKGSTQKHSYVRVDDKKEVYLAKGTFDNPFGKSVDELRDKEIFKVEKNAINAFEVKHKGRIFAFSKEFEEKSIDKNKKDDKVKAQDDKTGDKTKTEKVEKWTCKGFAGVNLNINRVESLLSSFSPLRAANYPDFKKENLGYPLSSIKLKAYGKEITLDIYNKKEEKNYFATSSESPFVFTITEWNAKKFFIENIDDLKEK